MKPKSKPLIPRTLARQDVEDAFDYYLAEHAEQAALGFVDALEHAYGHIARHPSSGIARYAHDLDLPGLLCWPLKRYPYLVFYVEYDAYIEVWRVLHGRRDMSQWLSESILH